MTALSPLRSLTGEGASWRIAGAAMLLLTLAGQHPLQQFTRARRADICSLLPNWRFFAPMPAMCDYHLLYRTVDVGGTASPWCDASGVEDRKPLHLLWFPTRRADKAVFDACQHILPILEEGFETAAHTPPYRLVTECVRARITSQGESVRAVAGFQFALATGTGYDTRHKPEIYFTSPYIPLDPQGPTTPLRAPSTPPARAKASVRS
ncbi:hypothetical protein [Wenjunlia tyrosinilytica]|uniref:Uncharacterized protein n=1 Tax=Wenjunlia tyrosinilytica TaxID=1544741 RepID=A0A917ZVT2_9ACTN|nr:hypothetical protein [Wenjunlia tyrosinilytica]GGO96785.1 hypothetical protein GCM10012280_57090 [Wenjunlia tyrosinilytica]